MEKIILSLKNIYMMLMNEDFPIYSESVIGRNERKGLTMLRFWQGQIVEEFRCLPCGKMIWRNDGKRNRYTSYLCNRNAEIKTYSEYAKEIASQVSTAALLSQIRCFEEFLSVRKYRHDILLRRIWELVRLTEAEDLRVSAEIAGQIREAGDWQSAGGEGRLFQAAYLLTLLTLYAAAGEAMDSSSMAVLRSKEFSIETLWKTYSQPREEVAPVSYLTVRSGLLQDNPLPQHRFFGREEELFNLKELTASGHKCMIRGIGGIGKTELLRQLIRICREERIVDAIAVVPYEGSIIESFARCFPGFQRQSPEESFRSVLYQLEQESAGRKVLLLIDNLTNGPGEDPNLLQLAELSCTVLITTRSAEAEGFETYTLENPAVSTGSLIFRDNYGCPLSREDQKVLTGMLEDEALCHPLTLRLMARAARSKDWSVQKLKTQLEKKDTLSWQEGDRTLRLSQVYRQLYSGLQIPEACREIAELFTLLPRDSYSPEFLRRWFPEVLDSASAEKLETLAAGGWLERDETGYSMHPLIAQCLRRTVLTEERLSPVTRYLSAQFAACDIREESAPENPEYLRICGIIRNISGFLSGSISREWLITLATALSGLDAAPQVKSEGSRLLDRLEKRCRERDDHAAILCLITRCRWLAASEEDYSSAYYRQKANRTVSEPLFLDLCLYGGYTAVYEHGNHPLAELMLREVLDGPSDHRQKASAYAVLIDCVSYQGKREEALKLSEAAVALVGDGGECGEILNCGLLSRLLQCCSILGRMEKAGAMASELERKLAQAKTVIGKYHLLTGLTSWSLNSGALDKALDYAMQNRDIVLQIRGRTMDYYISNGEVALILQRLNRYNEAIALYEDALSFMRRAQNAFWIQNTCSNLSVVYLEMEQPEKALACLDEAMEYARTMGGLALGAVLRNCARAYGQLGNHEEEYLCLKEACPLLAAVYGPDHPRSAAARQRLEELEKLDTLAGTI